MPSHGSCRSQARAGDRSSPALAEDRQRAGRPSRTTSPSGVSPSVSTFRFMSVTVRKSGKALRSPIARKSGPDCPSTRNSVDAPRLEKANSISLDPSASAVAPGAKSPPLRSNCRPCPATAPRSNATVSTVVTRAAVERGSDEVVDADEVAVALDPQLCLAGGRDVLRRGVLGVRRAGHRRGGRSGAERHLNGRSAEHGEDRCRRPRRPSQGNGRAGHRAIEHLGTNSVQDGHSADGDPGPRARRRGVLA